MAEQFSNTGQEEEAQNRAYADSGLAQQALEDIRNLAWQTVEENFLKKIDCPLGYIWLLILDRDFAEEISTLMAQYILGHFNDDSVLKENAIETAKEWMREYGPYCE